MDSVTKVNQICKYFARYIFVQMCKCYSRSMETCLEHTKIIKCMFENIGIMVNHSSVKIWRYILCLEQTTITRTNRIRIRTRAATAQRTAIRIPRIHRLPRILRILRTPKTNMKTAITSRTAATIQATAADSNGNRGRHLQPPFLLYKDIF